MQIADFTPRLAEEWDAFVAAHPHAAYGHLSANFALADETPGVRNVSLVVLDAGRIAGLIPLFLSGHRVLRGINVRELTSGVFFPAGPLVGPALPGKAEGKVLGMLMDGVRARACALNVDRVVITHPNVIGGQPSIVRFGYSPLLHQGYGPRHGIGLLLDLSRSADELAAGRQSGSGRWIKKAQAGGATTGLIETRQEWLDCFDLNVQTLGELAYTPRQMEVIWDRFIATGLSTAHAVRVGGAIASVMVTIQFNGSAYYWIGFNRRPAPVPGTGHLAMWTAVLAAREQGFGHFELGSLDFGNPKNMGISQFKQSFGGAAHQIVSAQLDMRPVKSAALALGEAIVGEVRRRRQARRAVAPPAPAAAEPAPPAPSGVRAAVTPAAGLP